MQELGERLLGSRAGVDLGLDDGAVVPHQFVKVPAVEEPQGADRLAEAGHQGHHGGGEPALRCGVTDEPGGGGEVAFADICPGRLSYRTPARGRPIALPIPKVALIKATAEPIFSLG